MKLQSFLLIIFTVVISASAARMGSGTIKHVQVDSEGFGIYVISSTTDALSVGTGYYYCRIATIKAIYPTIDALTLYKSLLTIALTSYQNGIPTALFRETSMSSNSFVSLETVEQ